MKPNRFRHVVAEGRSPVGHMIMEFGTRGIAKILESVDLDFVIFDMEHSGIGVERVFDLIAWAKATPIAPFVRVPQGHYHFIARIMDAGALGIMVANVQSAAQARDIVNAVKFAPMGYRGVGLGTAHTDYIVPNPTDYFEQANQSSVVICQIESENGVANAAEIAAVPGVDVLWVGHSDLSQSMGIPGQFHNPRFVDALKAVVSAAKGHNRLLGIQPGSPEQLDEWMSLGYHVISYSSDIAVYRNALADAVARVREAV